MTEFYEKGKSKIILPCLATMAAVHLLYYTNLALYTGKAQMHKNLDTYLLMQREEKNEICTYSKSIYYNIIFLSIYALWAVWTYLLQNKLRNPVGLFIKGKRDNFQLIQNWIQLTNMGIVNDVNSARYDVIKMMYVEQCLSKDTICYIFQLNN